MSVGASAFGARSPSRRFGISERAITASGLAAIGAYVVLLALLMTRTGYDRWGGALFAPLLVAVTLPALYRQAKREGDMRLFWLLTAGLLVKLLGALAREYVSFGIYGAAASDASGYHGNGVKISDRFRAGVLDPTPFLNPDEDGNVSYTDAMFIRLLTGIIYTITGPSQLGGYLIYSWMAFLGLFAFYRAFVMSIPQGRPRLYARLVFFLPSMVFWPSGIGKEAWMVFVLGLTALGAAHLFAGRVVRGMAIGTIGLLGVLVVRPHMAGIVGVSLAVAFVISTARGSARRVAPALRVVVMFAVLTGAVVLVNQATAYVNDALLANARLVDDSFEGADARSFGGVQSALAVTTARTDTGGSSFAAPSILQNPANAPLGIVTVLFRPFLFEAGSVGLLLAALEGSLLLALALVRLPSILATVRHLRRLPYATFALAYAAMFIVAFSSIANFGILTRQRVTLLPFFMILLCLPLRSDRGEPVGSRA